MPKSDKIFALVDCNNFFVSCERVFRPDLWDKPVAVMSSNDGCIVARSNEVKALGVPMGSPVFKVRDILTMHKVQLFSGNFPLYGDFSQRVVQILRQVCPDIEVYSVDESFLEISTLGIKDYTKWAQELRATILQWIGIPVSIGVAPTKTLAKAASEFAKKHPDTRGAFVINKDNQDDLLRWLDINDVWGIGRRTAPKLRQLGISKAYDLTKVTDTWAQNMLKITGLQTVKELRGERCLSLSTDRQPQKTILRSRSFGHDVRNYHELEGAVASFAAQATAKLRDQNEVAGEIVVFLKAAKRDEKYYGASKAASLDQPSADTGMIISKSLLLLQHLYDPDLSYKKAGIALVNLRSQDAWQISLLNSSPEGLDQKAQLMQTIDMLNKQFGIKTVYHASESLGSDNWRSRRDSRSPNYTTSWQSLPTAIA